MTGATDRKASAKDRVAEPPPKKPSEKTELDAEIVKDLELDERDADARGGCMNSKPTTQQ